MSHSPALPTANRLPVSVEMTQCIEENYEAVVDITADALVEDSEYSEWVCCSDSADVSSHRAEGSVHRAGSSSFSFLRLHMWYWVLPAPQSHFLKDLLLKHVTDCGHAFALRSLSCWLFESQLLCIGSQMNVWCWRLNCCNSEAQRGFPTFTNNITFQSVYV